MYEWQLFSFKLIFCFIFNSLKPSDAYMACTLYTLGHQCFRDGLSYLFGDKSLSKSMLDYYFNEPEERITVKDEWKKFPDSHFKIICNNMGPSCLNNNVVNDAVMATIVVCCFFVFFLFLIVFGRWLKHSYNYHWSFFELLSTKIRPDLTFQGAVSIRQTVLPGMAIPMLKIRRPNGRLIFNVEITIRK